MTRVFITGASSGIGAALAKRYAEEGATLGLVARRQHCLEQFAASLPHPERHRIYALDVTDHAALAAAAADFIGALGGADVVIANAGISQGTLTEYAEDMAVFERIVATNLLATVATFAPFIATLKAQAQAGSRACRLVGIASVAGIRGLPGAEAYSASKAAVISYCESLRIELRSSGGHPRQALTADLEAGVQEPVEFLLQARSLHGVGHRAPVTRQCRRRSASVAGSADHAAA